MKIGIIKLGAKGDVIRTLAILPAIKKKFPDSELHWITKSNISDILNGVDLINQVHEVPFEKDINFDLLYSLDFDEEATNLAERINAQKKLGFRTESGFPASYNFSAEDYLNTMFDDELKKNNKQTYQELIFKAAELDYNKEFCGISLTKEDKSYAQDFLKKNKLEDKIIMGIHMGAGPRWPSKAWHQDNIKEFILLAKKKGYGIILFGGPSEVESHGKLSEHLEKEGIKIYRNNPDNSNKEFAALIDICDTIVCSDSFALHVAIALKKKTIGLFFCTSPDEVEGYNLLEKVVSPKLYDYFPERMNEYDEELTKSISARDVAIFIR